MKASEEAWITWKKKTRRGGLKLSKHSLRRYKDPWTLFIIHMKCSDSYINDCFEDNLMKQVVF